MGESSTDTQIKPNASFGGVLGHSQHLSDLRGGVASGLTIGPATERLNELNNLELPQATGAPKDEVYGGDEKEVDIDLMNEQNV
jgi:hypothetical protein